MTTSTALRTGAIATALAAALAATSGCPGPVGVICDDGRVCPEGTTCIAEVDQCVAPEQIGSCAGRRDGEACSIDGAPIGVCRDRNCLHSACGDGFRSGVEVCEGLDVGTQSCQRFGWYRGLLLCNDDCAGVDVSQCADYCGDGIINGTEQCDGAALTVETCTDYGAAGGPLTCNGACQVTRERCFWGGWRSIRPPVAATLNAIWGSARDDIWAVGEADVLLHFDGRDWMRAPPTGAPIPNFHAVHGTAHEDVWAVGRFGNAIHFDGTSWTRVETGTEVHLYGVWGSAPDDYWAVGGLGTFLHYDGQRWSQVDVPGAPRMHGLWGRARDDIWAVGVGDSIYHYDGQSWSPVVAGDGSNSILDGIHGAGDTLWAVGDRGARSRAPSGEWTEVVSDTRAKLTSVFAVGPDDVWAVGGVGTIVHFAGGRGERVPLAIGTNLNGIWGSASSDLWAVGEDGALLHYDGAGFVAADDGSLGDVGRLTGSGAGDLWALRTDSAVARRDGDRWTDLGLLDPELAIADIWASGPDDLWAVGDQGAMFHRSRAGTVRVATPTVDQLSAVWGSGPADIWIASENGQLFHSDGVTVEARVAFDDFAYIYEIWGSGPDDVWAVADGNADGGMFHYDGVDWRPVGDFVTNWCWSVWGSGPRDVWAACSRSEVWHFDGATWSVTRTDGTEVNALGGSGPTDVWAAGAHGIALHYDGATWSRVPSPSVVPLSAVWADRPDDVWIGGWDGAFHLGHPLPAPFGGTCASPLALYCGASVRGRVEARPGAFATYACASRSDPGGEVYYRLDNPIAGELTIRLKADSGDLDLITLGVDGRGACDDQTVCNASQLPGGDEKLVFRAVPGEQFYVVVDNHGTAATPYTLEVSCDKQ